MSELIDQSSVYHLFQLFALAWALVVFWILENVWQTEKRWLIPILIFPCSIFVYLFVYWDENQAKCFFGALLLAVMLVIGGIVGYSFFALMIQFFKIVAFWPYFLLLYFFPSLP
jgi:hypothetical protein